MVNEREEIRSTYSCDFRISWERVSEPESDPDSAADLAFLGEVLVGMAGSLGFLLLPFFGPLFFLSPLSAPSLFFGGILTPEKNCPDSWKW